MATSIPMPALSPTMKEGTITRWLKKEGEKVSSGQPIAECETDKANLEIESYEDGILLKILIGEGQVAPVGSPIAWVGVAGEKIDAAPAAGSAPNVSSLSNPVAAVAAKTVDVQTSAVVAASTALLAPSAGRLRASPLARKMARERGYRLEEVSGSGPAGRIVKRDIEAVIARGARAPVAVAARATTLTAPTVLPLSSMRKVIAERLTEAKPGVPHFYLSVDIEMDQSLRIRDEAKAIDTKVSVNDIVVKASAMALRRHPKLNVQYTPNGLLQLSRIDVGVAVAIEDGLITPVLPDADQKGLAEIASQTRDLAERAKKKKLRPEEYTGGSMTVSNLGMYGMDSFVAVINPPQAFILAVGAVTPKPVVREGQMVIRHMMSVTLSGDHRAIDGALGAQYLRELQALLEHPMRLLF